VDTRHAAGRSGVRHGRWRDSRVSAFASTPVDVHPAAEAAARVCCAVMALTPTIHTFALEISDIDRGVYEKLDLRVARQPSETAPYMLSRVLAYSLEYNGTRHRLD
jgi:hypothetical protein